MTPTNDTLIKQILSELPHYTPHHSWTQVFKSAKAKGETDGYAAFLADEHLRLTGKERDV